MFGLLERVEGTRSELAAVPSDLTEAERIDLIGSLEHLKSAAAAAQARATADLAEARQQRELAGSASRRRSQGLAGEIGLARRESPVRGSQHLGLAKALVGELPHTFRALQKGALNEWRATLIARETACLSVEDRREVDRLLAADAGRVEGWGDRELVAQTKALAYRVDPHAVVARARRAEADRHVSVRPAPDTMSRLSALLPVAKGVACYAALKQHADTLKATGDARSRGQIMADALFERLTGRAAADRPPVEVKLVLTDRALFQGDSTPAYLEGYGTVPAQWARDLVRETLDHGVGVSLRQLYTHPVTGALVAMSSRRRCAPPGLADFVATRDQTCRTPWCDAPVRHTDHVWDVVRGGPTTAENTQGLCEQCNHNKQAPGWSARSSPGMRHLVVTRTPTGHVYRSTAPPMVGHEPSTGEFYRSTNVTVSYASA